MSLPVEDFDVTRFFPNPFLKKLETSCFLFPNYPLYFGLFRFVFEKDSSFIDNETCPTTFCHCVVQRLDKSILRLNCYFNLPIICAQVSSLVAREHLEKLKKKRFVVHNDSEFSVFLDVSQILL